VYGPTRPALVKISHAGQSGRGLKVSQGSARLRDGQKSRGGGGGGGGVCVQGSTMTMNDEGASDDHDRLVATINLTGATAAAATESSHAHRSAALAARVGVGAVLGALCLITVLGNTLVIHAVRTDRKLQTVSIAHCTSPPLGTVNARSQIR